MTLVFLYFNDSCNTLPLFHSFLCISHLRVIPVIPWNNTLSLSKGIVRLNKIYNSLKNGSLLKNYLKRNCLHLLSPLKSSTNVSVEKLNPLSLIEDQTTVKLSKCLKYLGYEYKR